MKRLSLLFLLAFATQAFAQFYVPPYQTWRQTLLTNLTMAGVRADLGIINATNIVVDDTVFTTTGDMLGLKTGTPVTNIMLYGNGGNVVKTNQNTIVVLTNVGNVFVGAFTGNATVPYAGVSSLLFGTGGIAMTNTAFGFYQPAGNAIAPFVSIHRNDPTNSGGLFFHNDYTYGGVSGQYMQLGFDSFFPGGPYWAIYLNSLGTDIMRIGTTNGIQGHIVFGSKAVPEPHEMVCINDFNYQNAFTSSSHGSTNDATAVQYSLALNSASNGLITRAWGNPYDGVTITKNLSSDKGWLTFMNDTGTTNRWRVGGLDNDFVIYEGAAATHTAPGNEVFKIKRDEQYHIRLKNDIEVGIAPLDMTQPTQLKPGLTWNNDSLSTDGWMGIHFTNGVDDMAIHKIGRYTKYGFTNESHTILLMTLSGGVMVTNVSAKLPRSASKTEAWVWADCYYVLPASTPCWIITDNIYLGNYWTSYAVTDWAWFRGIDTNIVTTLLCYTNGVLNPSFLLGAGTAGLPNQSEGNLGPTAYLRY
jgi:hypothetical protein